MKPRSILFDLDGTLIDQFEAIHLSFSQTLITMGYPPPSFDKVKRAVGGASLKTMEKLIGSARAQEGVEILRPIFEKEMFRGLKALPFTLDGLEKICRTGVNCAVLTNKYGPHARLTCDHLGFSKFLDFTLGANDTNWRKPDARLTQFALKKMNSRPDQTLYIGDSPYDFETAKNAGLRCFLVATGTHTYDELSLLAEDSVFQDFETLTNEIISML